MKADIEKENRKCKDRLPEHYKGRIEDLRTLWAAYQEGKEDVEDLGSIFDYGVSFDYVAPHTFTNQRRGYFRYQLSWGGPSDEFRFYCDEGFTPVRVEYWFMDWFDGAKKILTGKAEQLLLDLFEWFKEGGTVEKVYHEARDQEEG